MRLNWKFLPLVLTAALPLCGAGCGGVSANQSVSPASFFLPGLLRNDTPSNPPAAAPEPPTEIVSAL